MSADDSPANLLVLRVWLPDRPGALGAVATRIGAVGGDLVGIEIVDRGAGHVVDEQSVALANPDLVELLLSEIHDVEGVDVEDSRWLSGRAEDPVVSALQLAGRLGGVSSTNELAEGIVAAAMVLLHADWSMLVATDSETSLAAATSGVHQEAPGASWVCNFIRGVTESPVQDPATIEDLAMAEVEGSALALVVARERVPLRGRERSVLRQLCSLAASHPAVAQESS